MRRALAPALLSAAALTCAPPLPASEGQFEIVTLSNRADLVSGGDALVEVRVPRGVSTSSVEVRLNGRDVSAAFAPVGHGGTLRGLLTDLAEGGNDLVALIRPRRGHGHHAREAKLRITNHPIGGPVLSGEQIEPFFCATSVPQPATAMSPATNASGLSTSAFDRQCNMSGEFKLYYRSTDAGCSFALPDPSPSVNFLSTNPPTSAPPPPNPCFKPYAPGTPSPADLATTTTDAGRTVPYIVRVERGTMNRGIYDLAVLFDPERPWTGTAPQAQWNGKLLYQFGASTGQPRRQFRPAVAWTNDLALSRGFMVAGNSMSDSAANSNRVLMAETVMMMKEHIGDRYGPVRATIGSGCSGGSINSNMNASIAPGQLDGITIACAYPDSETTAMEVGDCVLLAEAYRKPAWLALMAGLAPAEVNAKKAAINGHPDQSGCHGWYTAFGNNGKAGNYVPMGILNHATGEVVPIGGPTNNCQLPFALVYDPASNPAGARCSAWDWAASIFGKALDGIHARETRDNTGVQYGLKALYRGVITPEEFVTLNEVIGGIDKDSGLQAARSAADPAALEIAYRAGIVMSGRPLAKTPVIDMRGWDDSALVIPPGNSSPSLFPIHYVWRSFAIRERLDRQFGDHGNQVLWRFGRNGLAPSAAMQQDAFLAMDQWLDALQRDGSQAPIEKKVRRARPASVFDFCLLSDDATQSVKVTDAAVCDADPFLKPSSSPRQVAGGPLAEDILKCRLKPLSALDYLPVAFTSAQWSRLHAAFADGVCDWERRGVGQQPALGPLDFSDGPGGVPLPDPPESHARGAGHSHAHSHGKGRAAWR
jgi:hypothetical protein